MKKFIVYLLVIVLAVSLGFAVFYLVRDNEVISISQASIYKDAGESFTIDVAHVNKKSYTSITISTSNANIVSYDSTTGNFKAESGGVARINFRTTNAKFRNLWCDVIVGDGTVESPYYISTPEQLASIGTGIEIQDENGVGTGVYAGSTKYFENYRAYSSDKCYKLVNNIDAKDINNGIWVPLRKFSGRFDGNGLTIKNVNIDKDKYTEEFQNASDYDPNLYAKTNVGLFQEITETGVVYNLKLENVFAIGRYTNFGIIAGVNKGTIERIEVKDAYLSVESDVFGGLVGQNISTDSGENDTYVRNVARIDRCSVNMVLGKKTVYDEDGNASDVVLGVNGIVGGLVGENMGGTIVYSYVKGEVSFLSDETNAIVFGGIVAHNTFIKLNKFGGQYTNVYQGGNVKDCYSNLKTHFEANLQNSDSLFAGVIANNEDYTLEVYKSDSSKEVVQNYIIGNYYNKDNLNTAEEGITKEFKGIAKFTFVNTSNAKKTINFVDTKTIAYGYTTEEMKDSGKYLSHIIKEIEFDENGNSLGLIDQNILWLFDTVWAISSETNDGLPYLNYQLVYVPDDFANAGIPIIANATTYTFESDEVVTPFTFISGNNGKLSLDVGESYTLKTSPSGLKLTWYSSDDSIVEVNASGVVTAKKVGVVTVTAKSSAGYTATITVVVHSETVVITDYPQEIKLTVGQTYTITGVKVNTSDAITYSVSNEDIATVSDVGVVRGLSVGTCTLTIKAGETSVTIPVTVDEKAVLYRYVDITLNKTIIDESYDGTQKTGTLVITSATYLGVDCKSSLDFTIYCSNTNILKITKTDNTTFTYTICGIGNGEITVGVGAPSDYIGYASCHFRVYADTTIIDPPQNISIVPASTTMNIGDSKQLSVIGATTPVSWSSSDSSVVSVTNGVVTAHSAGSAVITAYVINADRTKSYATANVTVVASVPLVINLSASATSVSVGEIVTITAIVNKTALLTWTNTNSSISTLNKSSDTIYTLTMNSAGSTTVVVSCGGTSASVTVTATAVDTYNQYISTPAQLDNVRNHLDKSFIIVNDIDLSAYNWTPIGTASNPFTGTIKGANSSIRIKNIRVNSSYTHAGLFGYASSSARFENMTITNANIDGGSYCGSLLGQGYNVSINKVNAESCNVKASVATGGIVGSIKSNSVVSNCVVSGQTNVTGVSGNGLRMVGGIVGENSYCTVSDCVVNNNGSISLASSNYGYVGGIVGFNSGSISNAVVSANIIANNTDRDYAGGVAGYNTGSVNRATVRDTSIQGYYAGGIGGALNVSGLITLKFSNYKQGYRKEDLSTSNYSTSVSLVAVKDSVSVKGNQVGGLFGMINSGVVSNCYTRANLSGNASNAVKGGFASVILSQGFNNEGGTGNAGIVENCYSACTFSGSGKNYSITSSLVHNYGGISGGETRAYGYCFNYVFDNDLDGNASYTFGSNAFKDNVKSKKSTKEMQTRSTYTDKSFSASYWNFGSGYPTLVNEA